MYARLPPEPQRKEPKVDLFPDTQEEGTKSGLSSYLDEFLSAIKVFGYLERPVFHELTRSMQTRKLIAGETLNLEEEQGFCLVVDGLVEIFVKSPTKDNNADSDASHNGADVFYSDSDDERHEGGGHQGYQLLTEVRNGAPMSSLFSILSLFTEDIKLRHTEDDEMDANHPAGRGGHHRSASDIDHNRGSPPSLAGSPPGNRAQQSRAETLRREFQDSVQSDPSGLPNIPPMSLDPPETPRPERPKPRRAKSNSVHPDIIARARVDTTIAIIPASAFRRLTRVYPKATSHIVQVILTRLQRVTLATGHSYLGLTAEVLRTERHMNKYTTYELPNFLRGSALARLKEKFIRERERIGPEDSRKGIALHNASAGRRRRSSTSLRKEATMHALGAKTVATPRTQAPNVDEVASPSPGDLLTNIHISRTGGRRHYHVSGSFEQSTPNAQGSDVLSPLTEKTFNPFASPAVQPQLHRQESIDEDGIFRGSILECIFKAIGLTTTQSALRMADSVEASPYLNSMDQRRTKPVFNNAFGFIDPYEGSGDGDTESVTSSTTSNFVSVSSQGLATELRDEVEIVYFPKGSVLVEQGERNPGLYYVIDGFLDVGIPNDDADDTEFLGRTTKSSSFTSQKSSQFRGSSRGSKPNSRAKRADSRKRKSSGRTTLSLIKPGGIAG